MNKYFSIENKRIQFMLIIFSVMFIATIFYFSFDNIHGPKYAFGSSDNSSENRVISSGSSGGGQGGPNSNNLNDGLFNLEEVMALLRFLGLIR